MYKAIFFDFDGTLTDSGEGITKSVQYALEKIGKPEPDLQKLRIFVGPGPFWSSLKNVQESSEETAKKGSGDLPGRDTLPLVFSKTSCTLESKKCCPG